MAICLGGWRYGGGAGLNTAFHPRITKYSKAPADLDSAVLIALRLTRITFGSVV